MDRRRFLTQSGLAVAGLPLLRSGLAGFSGPRQTPYQMRILRNNVGIFTEKGGTIAYYLSRKSVAVVDAEFPEQSQHLIDALKKDPGKPFDILINTHHHGDHTSGNISFKGIVGHVAAHSNSLINQRRVAEKDNSTDKQLFPDTTFRDTWSYKNLKEPIDAYYYGTAHTNGDSIIHFPHVNIAHMGDLVFNRRWAFVDRSAGASIKSWITVLDKAMVKFDKDTLFVYGHAFDPEKVVGGKDDLKAMQSYLSALLDYVHKEMQAGKSKEQVVKATSIPGVTEWKGDGIERGLDAAYDELADAVQ